jgi:hypothetical protein
MVGKRKLFILAIVLIPLLLGMTPLNLFNKLSGHCPFSQGKQIQRASSCLFHSIISQDDFNIPGLNSALLGKESTPSFHITAYNSTRSHISLISFPLLC